MDYKLLKSQLGPGFINKPNVYLDKQNLLMEKEVHSVYPSIFKLSKGEITSVSNFDQNLLTTE